MLVSDPVGVIRRRRRRRRRRLDPFVDAFVGADEVQVLRDGGAHGVVAIAETKDDLQPIQGLINALLLFKITFFRNATKHLKLSSCKVTLESISYVEQPTVSV